MSESDVVQVNVAVASATQPTVANLNTPLIACFHTHYPDRVRVYATQSAQQSMVADGFSVNEAAYKEAGVIAAVPNGPGLLAIGRRANMPLQTLLLACVDGTINDAYALTLVGSDGKSHALAYTNVQNPGAAIPGTALTGTATATQGSTAVTFTTAQTLAAGELVTFSNQAGASYAIAAATTSSTSAVLTAPFTGATASGLTVTPGATTAVTSGSASVTFSASQTLAAGALLTFASQPNTAYALASAVTSATSGTLVLPYGGTTAAAAYTEALAPLTGTFDAVSGSPIVPTTSSQVGVVYPGDSLMFASQGASPPYTTAQPGVSYTVLSVTASAVTLTQPFTGATAASAHATLVCTSATAAQNLAAQIAPLTGVGTASVVSSVAPAPNAGQSATVQLARTDGQLTDVQGWLSNGFATIQLTNATADPGIVADLTAIRAAGDADFYAVLLDSNGLQEIESAAQWTESTGQGGKILMVDTSDYANTVSTVTTDVFSSLKADSYTRTFCMQNNTKLLSYGAASLCATLLGPQPRVTNAAFQTLAEVPADSDMTLTENARLAINSMSTSSPGPGAKNGNFYSSIAGEDVVLWGCTPSGRFLDLTIFCDWLKVTLQQTGVAWLVGAAQSPGKQSYTQPSLDALGAQVQGVLRRASAPAIGGLVPDGQDPNHPIVVNVPSIDAISQTDKTNRNLSAGELTYSAGYQGAIDTITVTGTVTP